jgi:hypothetical protein
MMEIENRFEMKCLETSIFEKTICESKLYPIICFSIAYQITDH